MEASGYHYGEVPPEKVRAVLIDTRQATIDGNVYCESNQNLSLIIPELATVFPQARFIWLVRNGLDVVASAYQKQWYTGHSENHDRYEDCSPLEKTWIKGRVRADRVGEMSEAEWKGLDRFEKCCWYWGYVNRVIGEGLAQYGPGCYYTLRLEDLEQDLARLVTWMGFTKPILPNIPRENSAKRVPFHWSEWSQEQHQSFARWCTEGMNLFYPSWKNYVGRESKIFVAPALAPLRSRIEMLESDLRMARAENEEIKGTKNGKIVKRLKRLGAIFRDKKSDYDQLS